MGGEPIIDDKNWELFQAGPLDGYSLHGLFQEPELVTKGEEMVEELHSFVPPMAFNESSRGPFGDSYYTAMRSVHHWRISSPTCCTFPPQPDVAMLEHTLFDNFWDEDEVMDIRVGNGEVWIINKAMIDDTFWVDSAMDGLSKRLEAIDINKRKAKESLEGIWIEDPDMKQKMEKIKKGKRKVCEDIWGSNQGPWDGTVSRLTRSGRVGKAWL
ncbi:hypothetical protein RHGRI_016959 [Rhododendron griersonianum]|uniref:Uncharacterized protein n=1 Tax=Rhododendron griersonianum TaxID=479676 RepID=A0AAV6JW21_9ERIC|nr:hypothetical protein RHGRI_016959 [Rhododendron griersonianum]